MPVPHEHAPALISLSVRPLVPLVVGQNRCGPEPTGGARWTPMATSASTARGHGAPVRWRLAAGVGKALMAVGVVIALFALYVLWGTGFGTRAAQGQLGLAFDAQLATVAEAQAAGAEPAADAAVALLDSRQIGDPVARLQIPAIGVDHVVLEGVDLATLASGPGHFPASPLPGQPGNAAIAGHRSTYDAPFNLVNELVPGDDIVVTTVQGTFHYQVLGQPADDGGVYGYYLVAPTAVEILNDKGDNRLTLVGCHPRYGSAQRIVVEAVLVDPPAPATPAPELATTSPTSALLAQVPRGSWTNVVGWALTLAAVWALTWGVVTRWARRRGRVGLVVTYLVAVALTAPLLWSAFAATAALSAVPY